MLDLVNFAEHKVEDGTMKRRRLIFPGLRRLKKWVLNLWKGEDEGTEHAPDLTESGGAGIYSGQSFEAAKDPEHLLPTNAWQRFGNSFRKVGGVLGSVESAFGFRVACATFSIGIVAFLADTRTFFLEQRLVWAMIMVSIGMTVTAGNGVFGFFGRLAGTCKSDFQTTSLSLTQDLVIAMCTSFITWYIVDGHSAGVIVFVFVFVFMEFYFIMKYPRFIVVAILSIVTQGRTTSESVSQKLTLSSLNYWIRTRSQESWVEGECALLRTLLHRSSDIVNRWPPATASLITISIYLRRTDWHVSLAACSLLSSGPFSPTP